MKAYRTVLFTKDKESSSIQMLPNEIVNLSMGFRSPFYKKSFEFNGTYLWNKLPRALKTIRSKDTFRQALWEHLLHSA